MKDYYRILDVLPDASTDTIKSAFRKKVSILHPDKNTSHYAKEEFTDLIEAYEILSKPKKRTAYDTLLKEKTTQVPVVIKPKVKEDFKEYEKEAKKTSKKYKDYSLEEFLLLEIFLDVGFESLFSSGLDLLDDAGDIIGDIFDIF